MKTVLLLAFAFVLSSCGNDSRKANSGKDQNPYYPCGNALTSTLCSIAPAWTITSSAVNFPKNFQIKMEDGFDVDTCTRSGFFKVSKNAEGKMDIKFKYPHIPNQGFSVEIIDRGEKCDNNAIFHQEDSVVFGTAEITINGRLSGREVYVTLQN